MTYNCVCGTNADSHRLVFVLWVKRPHPITWSRPEPEVVKWSRVSHVCTSECLGSRREITISGTYPALEPKGIMSKQWASTHIISGRSPQHVTPMTPHPTSTDSPCGSRNVLFLHSQTIIFAQSLSGLCANCTTFPLYSKKPPPSPKKQKDYKRTNQSAAETLEDSSQQVSTALVRKYLSQSGGNMWAHDTVL